MNKESWILRQFRSRGITLSNSELAAFLNIRKTVIESFLRKLDRVLYSKARR